MSSANRCVGVLTGSPGTFRRLDRVLVGTLVSSAAGAGAASSALELEYPGSELELELLAPELPASCNPPGGAGFTSPEPDEDEDDDPAGCSPGYGNCCAGLFGAWEASGAAAPGAL